MKSPSLTTRFFLALVLVFGTIMAVGSPGGIDGAEENADTYCRNVHDGVWPDYEKQYVKFCNGPKWNGK